MGILRNLRDFSMRKKGHLTQLTPQSPPHNPQYSPLTTHSTQFQMQWLLNLRIRMPASLLSAVWHPGDSGLAFLFTLCGHQVPQPCHGLTRSSSLLPWRRPNPRRCSFLTRGLHRVLYYCDAGTGPSEHLHPRTAPHPYQRADAPTNRACLLLHSIASGAFFPLAFRCVASSSRISASEPLILRPCRTLVG